jgi:hypothetical protein
VTILQFIIGLAVLMALALMLIALAGRRRPLELAPPSRHRFRDPATARMAGLARGLGATMTTTMNGAPAQTAGRPQPQTTVEPADGGPFIRHSQPGRAPQYVVSGTSLSTGVTSFITQPMVARPGYFRGFRILFQASGGTGTAATYQADKPFSLVSLLQLKDAFGTPIFVGDGYTMLYLVPLFSGGFGLGASSDVSLLPSFTAFATNGNGSFSSYLPLELSKGYGVISGANAALLPTLQFNINPNGLYNAFPTGAATLQTTVDADFYWLPEGAAVEPPGLGTTRQWVLQQANPTVASGATARVQLPRLGGYLDTLIFIARDSTNARHDIWPGFVTDTPTTLNARLQIYVDGVPLIDSTIEELMTDMQIQFGWTPTSLTGGTAGITGGNTRPLGVLAVSRKTSLSQQSLGLLETGESFLSTNPGTLIEIAGAPWGTLTNSPGTLNVCVGQVVPVGNVVQGLPEV